MARGDATRQRILEAAERLVGERGVAALSLREAGSIAGARNNSAALYHFGSKAALIDAIFELRMREVNARREALLDSTSGPGPDSSDGNGESAATSVRIGRSGRSGRLGGAEGDTLLWLASALVVPLVESLDPTPGSTWYGRFLAAFLTDPAATERIAELDRPELTGIQRWVGEVNDALGHLPRLVRDQRIDLAVRLTVMAVADYERARDAEATSTVPPALLANGLVDAVRGLLDATPSDTTLALLETEEILR